MPLLHATVWSTRRSPGCTRSCLDGIERYGGIAMLDAPERYVYRVTGRNTGDQPHFERILKGCTDIRTGPDHDRRIEALSRRVGPQLAQGAPTGEPSVPPPPPDPGPRGMRRGPWPQTTSMRQIGGRSMFRHHIPGADPGRLEQSCPDSVAPLCLDARLDPRLPPPAGEVSDIRGTGIVGPSVRAIA